ncbi:MAG TPA: RNA-binding protein, partial [Armatimonadota bacterium]
PYGPVSEVRIIAGRGFGFVDIPEENASAAIEATNGKDFQGRALNVSEAKPKTERSATGYSGSRGGYAGRAGGGSSFGGGGGGQRGGSSGGGRRDRW